ncbi:hypothetical protein ABVT39_026351, partial [Epinephelus coioides]
MSVIKNKPYMDHLNSAGYVSRQDEESVQKPPLVQKSLQFTSVSSSIVPTTHLSPGYNRVSFPFNSPGPRDYATPGAGPPSGRGLNGGLTPGEALAPPADTVVNRLDSRLSLLELISFFMGRRCNVSAVLMSTRPLLCAGLLTLTLLYIQVNAKLPAHRAAALCEPSAARPAGLPCASLSVGVLTHLAQDEGSIIICFSGGPLDESLWGPSCRSGHPGLSVCRPAQEHLFQQRRSSPKHHLMLVSSSENVLRLLST